MAVMDVCSPHPTPRLCEAEREASGIDAMVLLGGAHRDCGWPVDVSTDEENT
ncbi:hypothetical protein C8E89_113143 [Mycolicibacterium moriokaense]|uniref:Uncharacterized protein n=1 Tax=Mycolicibacterium moriokaense TaxID=39691 RepID=A0A318HDV3_9MYCO|nr:hypothetical protein C8E89_113143 [Mycolicibacterium moriokaense]